DSVSMSRNLFGSDEPLMPHKRNKLDRFFFPRGKPNRRRHASRKGLEQGRDVAPECWTPIVKILTTERGLLSI
ncbi:hypothetical protein, partial [Pseudomonas helleri]|uniref:hypothetical protein n=1 Tax=Pseudomonas helleri TaxID=1608996 RepID=UPI00396A3DAD